MTKPNYKRVLLKLGGEALAGEGGFGVDLEKAEELAKKVKNVHDLGVEIGIVLGGGNIWRGTKGQAYEMNQPTSDNMGMLATVINCLALSDALQRIGLTTRVHTAVEMKALAEPYNRLRAIRHLGKGYIVILGAGTGNPYFTTDTAAALRAMEISADILIKATKVDGIYTDDPKINPKAEFLKKLGYVEAINKNIKVLDNTAITLCMNNKLPILIVNLWEEGSLKKAVMGEKIGSLISN